MLRELNRNLAAADTVIEISTRGALKITFYQKAARLTEQHICQSTIFLWIMQVDPETLLLSQRQVCNSTREGSGFFSG